MKNQKQKNIYLYGKHVVELAIKNPQRKVLEIYATKETAAEMHLPQSIVVHPADKRLLDSLVGQNAVHQGIVANFDPLPQIDFKTFIQSVKYKEKALVIILDQVTDPHNIGAIMRSAVAFHAVAVIMPDAGAPSESGVLAKSASGATELIPLIRVANLAHAMDMLKKAEFWCVGMDGYAQDTIGQSKLPKRCALVMGAEDGMRDLTKKSCDMLIKLPMNPAIESLNVSIATAVAMYEWMR